MRLITPVIDTMIVVATVSWGGALLWWWQHGLRSFQDAFVLCGLILISITYLVCIFSK